MFWVAIPAILGCSFPTSLSSQTCCFPVCVCVSHLTFSCPCLGQNFGLDWCKQPDVGLPKPDLILFLQLNPEAAAERGNFGQERYETSSFQEKVLQCFYCLMEDKTLNWKTVDASKSIEDLHREIKSIAKETMQEVQNKPLGELWK